jgi:acyl carrier protein
MSGAFGCAGVWRNIKEWDSLDYVRLIFSVEKAFRIRFFLPEIGDLKNIVEMETSFSQR